MAIINLSTLAKTSTATTDYFQVQSEVSSFNKKMSIETLFPSMTTLGTSSEALFVSVTNKNQLNFKGIKSGDTGLLTVATSSNNIELTVLEAGIDLSLCNNATSGFITGVDFTGTVTGECGVTSGGTGLSTLAKGSVLYASATDVISSATMATNGQLLIGNATTGYPSVATLTAGASGNVTITNGAGSITIEATLSTLAADLDCDNNDIDLGTGYLSSDGNQNGIRITGNNAYIGDTASYHNSDNLNLGTGGIRFASDVAANIKPSAATGSTAGSNLTIESGSSVNNRSGDLQLTAGEATGSGTGGSVVITAGQSSSGTDGDVQIKTYTGSSATNALVVGAEGQDVTVATGSLVITGATEGIVHTNSGTVTQATDHTTGVTINASSGIITLAAVALANDTNAEFTVTNSYAKTTSVILVSMQDENTTNNAQLSCATHTHANGSFKISVHHADSVGSTSTTASKIHFLIINPS